MRRSFSSTVLWSTSSENSNSEILDFIVPTTGIYTIKIYLRENASYGNIDTRTIYGIITMYSLHGYNVLFIPSC